MPEGLGSRFKEVRKKLGHSATRMAEAVGLGSRKSWENYEKGNHVPNGIILTRLAELGIDATWLLTGDGSMIRADAPAQAAPAAPSDIDEPLLKDIVSAVETHLDERRIALSPEKKSLLISELYMLMLEEDMDEHASNDLVSRLVRLSS